MRNSVKSRNRIYVKGYGFLFFINYIDKNLSRKYGQKLPHITKKSTTNALKTASKSAIQKTAEAEGHLVGNKIAENIIKTASKSTHKDQKNLRKYYNQQVYLKKSDNK